MEFWKRNNTTDTTDFCPRQLVTNLTFMLRTCYGEVANLLRTCYGETGVMNFGLNARCIKLHDQACTIFWRLAGNTQGLLKHFKGPCLFWSTFKGLEFLKPNSSTFKDFSSTWWDPETYSVLSNLLQTTGTTVHKSTTLRAKLSLNRLITSHCEIYSHN